MKGKATVRSVARDGQRVWYLRLHRFSRRQDPTEEKRAADKYRRKWIRTFHISRFSQCCFASSASVSFRVRRVLECKSLQRSRSCSVNTCWDFEMNLKCTGALPKNEEWNKSFLHSPPLSLSTERLHTEQEVKAMPRTCGEQRKRVWLRAHRPEMQRTEMDYHQPAAWKRLVTGRGESRGHWTPQSSLDNDEETTMHLDVSVWSWHHMINVKHFYP